MAAVQQPGLTENVRIDNESPLTATTFAPLTMSFSNALYFRNFQNRAVVMTRSGGAFECALEDGSGSRVGLEGKRGNRLQICWRSDRETLRR